MKLVLFLMILLISINVYSYEEIEGRLCSTARQKNPWIEITLYFATSSNEQTYAVKKEFKFNGSLVSDINIEGTEPDVSFVKATTEDGRKLFIINYFVDDFDNDTVET